MSDLYDPRYTRGGYGKYNKNKHFVSMEAGTDAFYLEDEANENQWIQNELRAELIRREYYSGIYQKHDNDIISSYKIFNDNSKIYNSFLVKPMTANVNGYLIDILGNNGFNNLSSIEGTFDNILIKKLNYIQLPDPPDSGNFYDFVFLEMCFTEIKFSDDIWHLGNVNNSFGLINNDLFDRRINGETNRRIQLKWNINVARVPVDYMIANEQLLTNRSTFALFDESLYAQYVPAKGAYHKNSILGFWNAPMGLDKKTDSDDIGLWIAGTGLDETGFSRLHTTDGYSYAIPLFKVIRRNTQSFYSANLLGGDYTISNQDSSTIRPDGKFANIIYEDDIIDLRNFIRVDNISKILHNNFENLLLNKSKQETKLYSTYFGMDAIATDNDTLFYEGCNVNSFDTTLVQGMGKTYTFVPGVEQEAVKLGESTLLTKDFSIPNVNLKGLTTQFFVYVPNGTAVGLYTIFDTLYGARLIAYIKNNNLFVVVNSDIIVYNFYKHINKFTHIAIAVNDTDLELIINNKSVCHKNLAQDVNLQDDFTVKYGFADIVEYFAQDCIFDEIELSNIYENKFNRIPAAIGEDNADISIDTQLGRKNYTLISNTGMHTFHNTYRTNNDGKLIFALTAPLTLKFTDDIPTIYFDNESVQVDTEVNVQWQKSSEKWYCTITGLGVNVTYNLVIIARTVFPTRQGIFYLPKKAYAAHVEKTDKIFYAVADSIEEQEHNVGYSAMNQIFNDKNKFVALNTYVTQLGFCVYLRWFKQVNNSYIVLDKNTIYSNIVGIYSIMYKGQNVLNDFYKMDDNTYRINLTQFIDNDEVEIRFIIQDNCCIYSPTKSGILNLCQLEEINDFGNGTRTTFTYRSNTRILALMQGKFNNSTYHYAYVNNHPERVNITIDGTFIHYTFEHPPVNKADIKTYIVTEYDPLRSERIEFIYEIAKDAVSISDISYLDQTDIVYYEDKIFVTTDGYGVYPYQKNNFGGTEVRLSELSAPLKNLTVSLNNLPNEGDMVIVLNTGLDLPVPLENNPYSYTQDEISTVPDDMPENDPDNIRYSTLRAVTEDNQIHDDVEVHGSDINSAVMQANGIKYNYNTSADQEIPLFTFKVIDDDGNNIHSLADDNIDSYTFYMLNKVMPTLDNLPMIEHLQFKISPVDILTSNKCNIIFGSDNEAHIIVKDALPISTNLTAAINYCTPEFFGTFLTTFNKLQTENAIPVIKGYRNCSIDNKSFYSLTTLDEKMPHINVFPVLIKDTKSKILKMVIFAQFSEDDKICIEAAYSAMDIYGLDNKYLIKHI